MSPLRQPLCVRSACYRNDGEGKTKGFGWIKACLGFLFFSLPGILCGLCGMGKSKTRTKSTTIVVNVCQHCGYRF